ncbi:MAG: carboxypeptidase-like regulatory domain-containing protein [Bacteroidales bacterium]|nr:carboxypeptidase-like regulatory domain-containing protein [Bacteroidales bacterium]
MKKILIPFLLVALSALPSVAQTLQGVILLNDSTPCPYATVYIASANRGIAANEKGEYMLDELPAGNLKVEYSCMGQQTVRRELTLVKGETLVHNEALSEKLMLLPPAIVTPDGETPAHYVLRHVWDKANENRSRIDSWQAAVKYDARMNDMDLIFNIIPKKYMILLKSALALAGYKKIFNLALDHPSLKAKVSLVRTYANGKITDSEQKIVECNENLTADEQKTLYKNKLLIMPDIFDEVYDDYEDWGRHGSARDKFQLVGSYEQDDKMIDVLEYVETRTTEREKVNEQGEKVKEKRTRRTVSRLHVVEDDWGILKAEKKGEHIQESTECRDLGGGIYMPISSSSRLTLPSVPADTLPKLIANAEKKLKDPNGFNKTERKMAEKLIKQLKEHEGRDIRMELFFAYDIKYRYFKLK